MDTVDATIDVMIDIIAKLRAVQEATHKKTSFRHQVWLGLWQRGYGLSDIANVSGHSRERVRMILRQMHDGQMPAQKGG